MDQLRKLIAALTLKQKLSLVAAAALVAAALYGLARWNHERNFQPLYSGLSAEDAGHVIARLRELGVEYRVADGGASVLVPSGKVAELRIQMAASGLPRSGRIGFELFDRTNLGATDFAEKVNFHRALEGELERSVMSLAEVERARVHITMPRESVFRDLRQPAKASVMVKLRPGAALSPENVQAICYLVSSAVQGLEPEAVSVLDFRGKLLSRPRSGNGLDAPEPSSALIEYRRTIEKDLLAKIHRTLEPVLGPDGFRAGVSVECDFSSGEQSEEIFDPEKSVMVSSERTEDLSGGYLAAGGIPGTASNLPRPKTRPGKDALGHARRSESIAYQTSRVVRKVRLPQGQVTRISVALLVDHQVRWEGEGEQARRIVEPVPPERLEVLRELVAGAVGLKPERGDQLIVETLPFESTRTRGRPETAAEPDSSPPIPAPDWLRPYLEDRRLILAGAAAALLLLLLLVGGGLWWWRRRRRRRAQVSVPKAIAAGSESEAPALEGSTPASEVQKQLAEQLEMKKRLEEEAVEQLKLPQVKTKKAEVLTKHLAEEAGKDPAAMAQLVRTWLNEEDL